ncbi:MAG: phosphoribosylanthranilate isomerase [Desulfovibrionaceae bacterium]|nr:phosphoribosylanthranilate isomerase [Desulfovibrionaceae bacterium]
MPRTKLKICGCRRQEDLDLAASLGVDFCGFIFHPKSPRFIEPEVAARLDSGGMLRVGVFVTHTLQDIQEIVAQARLDLVQLHGGQDEALAENLGRERVIRVLWPERYLAQVDGLACALAKYQACAYYLFDAGVQSGGSGSVWDWQLLAHLKVPKPFFLAGGLNIENLPAVLKMQPFAVDLNSGLEIAPGVKDPDKIRAAVEMLN